MIPTPFFRRILGKYLLQVTYALPLGAQHPEATVIGVQAQDINLQRGFLTLEAAGRRQVRIECPPRNDQWGQT